MVGTTILWELVSEAELGLQPGRFSVSCSMQLGGAAGRANTDLGCAVGGSRRCLGKTHHVTSG